MIWFTSDQHFDHANIITFCARPFAGLAEMQRELISRHNARVRPGDTVYHLGDFCLDERRVATFLAPLAGEHVLIAGNHDGCHPCHRRHVRSAQRYLLAGFRSVHAHLHFPELDALLCHLPYANDAAEGGRETRYPEYRPKDEGKWLLCGHVHEAWRTNRRMLNVGVDQHDYAPISISEVREIIGRPSPMTGDFV